MTARSKLWLSGDKVIAFGAGEDGVWLAEEKTLERSEGKSNRVINNRKL